MKSSNQSGRSMIEILAVLAITGVLTAAIASTVGNLIFQYKHSIIAGQVRDLRKNINNRYAADGRYTGLQNSILINERLVPYSMMKGAKILNAFGGEVTVSPASTACTNCSFTISFPKIPKRTCLELAVLDWKADATSTLVSITVNGTKYVWPYNKLGGSGGFSHENVTNPLPISSGRALSSCNSALDNTLIWEFH